jgi:hypothetical protein
MQLSSLHLLLTYQCTLECDHCFVWGGPWQTGTLTLAQIEAILAQAEEMPGIESIYFEGGEPFLYYATLLAGARAAHRLGFEVGIVSNGYWATGVAEALETLRPFVGLIQDLSVSSDLYHWSESLSQQAEAIRAAADQLGLPAHIIAIAQPEAASAAVVGQLPPGESTVMYRGRAAAKLAGRAASGPWQQFDACPHEDLREPGRVHVDPFGNVHICQGISLGNLFQAPLRTLCANYEPEQHPITGPLLAGGPAELVRRYELPHQAQYADACHLCDEARRRLRPRFAQALAPDQMYGVPQG